MLLFLLTSFFACKKFPCDDNGTYRAHDEQWTCTDGCNTCSCSDGAIFATQMACPMTCTDTTGTHEQGESWTCPDGCNTCSCESTGEIVSTAIACGDTGGKDTGGGDTGGKDTGDSKDTGGKGSGR